jgi:hypothetical protein
MQMAETVIRRNIKYEPFRRERKSKDCKIFASGMVEGEFFT